MEAVHGLANVLVLEDNAILAIDMEEMLRDMGASSVRVSTSVDDARQHLETGLTLALLDFTLKDGTAEAFAAELDLRGVPYLFVSGYVQTDILPVPLRPRPFLAKPFTQDALRQAVADVLHQDRLL